MSTWWLLQKFHPAENTSAHPSAITDANCKASHSANVVLSLKLSDFDIAASPNVVRREDCSTASQNCPPSGEVVELSATRLTIEICHNVSWRTLAPTWQLPSHSPSQHQIGLLSEPVH